MKGRILLATLGIFLFFGLVFLWAHRFQVVRGIHPISLSRIKLENPYPPAGFEWQDRPDGPSLVASVKPGEPRLSWMIPLPQVGVVEALHVRVHLVARDLVGGAQKWDDGRVLVEWRSANRGSAEETDPICSARESRDTGRQEMVVRCNSKGSIPVLWVEHLGESGELELRSLSLVPVRQRETWAIGRWILLGGCFVWLLLLICPPGDVGVTKRTVATIIWLGMATVFAFPGPWKTLRPFVIPFALPDEAVAEMADLQKPTQTQFDPSKIDSGTDQHRNAASEPKGGIPVSGGWIIQLKNRLSILRPLLHALLLAGPALAFAWLLGRHYSAVLSVSLALAIELAQTGFGYGFDWVDVLDLATNTAGILAGIWTYGHLAGAPRKFARDWST